MTLELLELVEQARTVESAARALEYQTEVYLESNRVSRRKNFSDKSAEALLNSLTSHAVGNFGVRVLEDGSPLADFDYNGEKDAFEYQSSGDQADRPELNKGKIGRIKKSLRQNGYEVMDGTKP